MAGVERARAGTGRDKDQEVKEAVARVCRAF